MRFTVFVISENSSSSVVLLPLAPVSLIVQLFDAFLAFSLLFGSFLLYVQEGSAASIQVDMQIEAAARLKSTLSDLPELDISRNISFGAPPPIFTFIPCFEDGSAASVQVDMQIEAAARLKSTLSNLPALELSRNISFAPPHICFAFAAIRQKMLRLCFRCWCT